MAKNGPSHLLDTRRNYGSCPGQFVVRLYEQVLHRDRRRVVGLQFQKHPQQLVAILTKCPPSVHWLLRGLRAATVACLKSQTLILHPDSQGTYQSVLRSSPKPWGSRLLFRRVSQSSEAEVGVARSTASPSLIRNDRFKIYGDLLKGCLIREFVRKSETCGGQQSATTPGLPEEVSGRRQARARRRPRDPEFVDTSAHNRSHRV